MMFGEGEMFLCASVNPQTCFQGGFVDVSTRVQTKY